MSTFVLNAFESTISLDLSATLVGGEELPTLDTSAVAVYQVSLEDMKKSFMYHTDSNDITDVSTTDLKFFVDKTQGVWATVNPANALVEDASAIYIGESGALLADNKKMVCHDFVRYIASKLFNTHYGVDLFNNEDAVRQDIRSVSSTGEGHAWQAVLDALDAAIALEEPNGAGVPYDEENDANIACVLFRQIMKSNPERLADLSSNSVLNGQNTPIVGKYMLPFLENDSIDFKITINAATGQGALTGVADPPARSYRIKLLLKTAPVEPIIAGDEVPEAP